MGYFVSFEMSENKFDYFFNSNHFLLLFISLVIIIFFSMYATRQKLHFQKIFVFVCGVILAVVEGLRIFWRYKFLQANNLDLSFLNVTNLDFFTLSLWISLPLILLGAMEKKDNFSKVNYLFFVFFLSMLSAIITLVYPTNLNENFEFYHFYNLAYIVLRSLVIMLGLFFCGAKWIKVSEFSSLWHAMLSNVVFAVFAGLIYFVAGRGLNLFFFEFCPIFEELGIHIPFPYHLLLLGAFLFMFQMIIHATTRIFDFFKMRRRK